MENNEVIIPDPEVFMRASAFDTIDYITNDLLNIEESARIALGMVTCGDQLLTEFNMPVISELMQLPSLPVWVCPEFG